MWLKCPECRDESAFEQPPCGEGHGLDCPEWFCVSCGFAVFVGGLEESFESASTPVVAAASPFQAQPKRSGRAHAA